MRRKSLLPWVWAVPLFLSACASVTPTPASHHESPPPQWHAPLPHQGQRAELSRWWQQWNDPVLLKLIESAQDASPTLAAAQARIDQSRANLQLAQANLGPNIDATASANRGRQTTIIGTPIASVAQIRAQASWETDLFGQNHALRDAANLRLQGAQAAWHEARVSLAADVANLYFALRACEQSLVWVQSDAKSRETSAQISRQQADAGFATQASAAMAHAAAAELASRVKQQTAMCEVDIKGLVALTGQAESTLRQQLAAALPPAGVTPSLTVETVPAVALSQRPDVLEAERQVAAASAELGSAQAERYPRLSLTGALGQMNLRMGGSSFDLSTWSIGPVTLSVPLWDNGRFAANAAAAAARYDEAAAQYRAKVRQAVREVEEALINLDSAQGRQRDLLSASQAYRRNLQGAKQRFQEGLTTRNEVEELHRAELASQVSLTDQVRDTRLAWVALYRAIGGGWQPHGDATPAPAKPRLAAATAP